MITQKLPQKASRLCMGPSQIIWKLESNAYVLDFPDNLGINPIFNVEYLTLHRHPFERPFLSLGVSAVTPVPTLPPLPQPHTDTEMVLDEEFV